MLIELGHYLVILAAVLCMRGCLSGVTLRTEAVTQKWRVTLATACCVGAFLILMQAFFTLDFSVRYVAEHAHSQLPWWYRLTALWAGHEGSMLLWGVVLLGWLTAFAWQTRFSVSRNDSDSDNEIAFYAMVLRIGQAITGVFLIFMLCTSNPFSRLLPMPAIEGADLNPLLQDIGLIIHPPIWYMGYLGLFMPYCIALAAMLTNTQHQPLGARLRPWLLASWSFLTVGIALGSWWAYYELGWGGWWFWDPVENASLMPWIIGLILIHALIHEQVNTWYQHWVYGLSILAFSFSVLGTFLVRSGMISSVHSFATDLTKGLYLILIWAALMVVGFGTLWWKRAGFSQKGIENTGRLIVDAEEETEEKEEEKSNNHPKNSTNNIWLKGLFGAELLVFLMLMVIAIGTLYPLFCRLLFSEEFSVGPAYFQDILKPIVAVLLMLMVCIPGQAKRYADMTKKQGTQSGKGKHSNQKRFRGRALLALICVVLGMMIIKMIQPQLSMLSIWLFCWLLIALLASLIAVLPWTVRLAHISALVSLLAMWVDGQYAVSSMHRLLVGQSVTVQSERFTLVSLTKAMGPNYEATQATIHCTPAQDVPHGKVGGGREVLPVAEVVVRIEKGV